MEITWQPALSNSAGPADYGFSLGWSGDIAVAGDWDGNGTDTIGVFRPSNGYFYLRNANTSGVAELIFPFGDTTDVPLAGNWDGVPSMLPPTPTPSPTPVTPPALNASFTYDGDGKRVKSTINGTTTYFVGAHYEVTGSTITKYYYAGTQRIAMRTNGALNFLLGDHLGSTSLTTDASGNVVSEMRYKAWGEVRYASGNAPTQYQYTGQFSYESQFGLYFYNARWLDGSLGRFAQADTIIPQQSQGVQAWDRYAYTNNNPVRYTDPTGHQCAPEDDCGGAHYSLSDRINIWKWRIKDKFGIEMSDDKGEWDILNLEIIFTGLSQADKYLGANARSIVGGSIFYLKSAPTNTYSGLTSGLKITFSTSSTVPFQNLYHEFAHLLDNGLNDAITNKLGKTAYYYKGAYLFGGHGIGEISDSTVTDLLLDDPYRTNDVKAFQHESSDPIEQWADMFANLVAGNIDTSDPHGPGQIMYTWTRTLLYPYVGLP